MPLYWNPVAFLSFPGSLKRPWLRPWLDSSNARGEVRAQQLVGTRVVWEPCPLAPGRAHNNTGTVPAGTWSDPVRPCQRHGKCMDRCLCTGTLHGKGTVPAGTWSDHAAGRAQSGKGTVPAGTGSDPKQDWNRARWHLVGPRMIQPCRGTWSDPDSLVVDSAGEQGFGTLAGLDLLTWGLKDFLPKCIYCGDAGPWVPPPCLVGCSFVSRLVFHRLCTSKSVCHPT